MVLLFLFSGGLDSNLKDIISRFKDGVKVKIREDPNYPSWGLCDTVVGRVCFLALPIKARIF